MCAVYLLFFCLECIPSIWRPHPACARMEFNDIWPADVSFSHPESSQLSLKATLLCWCCWGHQLCQVRTGYLKTSCCRTKWWQMGQYSPPCVTVGVVGVSLGDFACFIFPKKLLMELSTPGTKCWKIQNVIPRTLLFSINAVLMCVSGCYERGCASTRLVW